MVCREHTFKQIVVEYKYNRKNEKFQLYYITKDIIWYDSTSTIPVIGTVSQEFTARQYDTTNIQYTVYDPTTEAPTIEIAVDGKVVSTPTLDKATNTYPFRTDVVGEHIITITCGETIKTIKESSKTSRRQKRSTDLPY